MFGGSTGTVIAGACRWLAARAGPDELTAVAIAPDFGERYLDTIYNDTWVTESFGGDALRETEHLATLDRIVSGGGSANDARPRGDRV